MSSILMTARVLARVVMNSKPHELHESEHESAVAAVVDEWQQDQDNAHGAAHGGEGGDDGRGDFVIIDGEEDATSVMNY